MSSQHRQLHQVPETVLEALGEAAEMWGAGWHPRGSGGRLILPVVQGLRHGIADLAVVLEPNLNGTSLSFSIEETSLVVNKSALAILILGGLGGLVVALWPLSPKLLLLAPIGAVLAFLAWLLVVSKLRNSSADDFFDLVADLAGQP